MTYNNESPNINALIQIIESLQFDSEADVDLLRTLNETVEKMLVYAMTLNLTAGV